MHHLISLSWKHPPQQEPQVILSMLQDFLSASFTREVHFPLMPGIWKVRRWQVYFAWLKWKSWCINKNRSAPETDFADTLWHTWSMWQKVTVLKLIHETNIFPHGFPLFDVWLVRHLVGALTATDWRINQLPIFIYLRWKLQFSFFFAAFWKFG